MASLGCGGVPSVPSAPVGNGLGEVAPELAVAAPEHPMQELLNSGFLEQMGYRTDLSPLPF